MSLRHMGRSSDGPHEASGPEPEAEGEARSRRIEQRYERPRPMNRSKYSPALREQAFRMAENHQRYAAIEEATGIPSATLKTMMWRARQEGRPIPHLRNPRGIKRHWNGNGQGLPCPVCGSQRLYVVTSRSHLHTLRRIRQCKPCGFRFFTKEIVCDFDCNPVETDVTEGLEHGD